MFIENRKKKLNSCNCIKFTFLYPGIHTSSVFLRYGCKPIVCFKSRYLTKVVLPYKAMNYYKCPHCKHNKNDLTRVQQSRQGHSFPCGGKSCQERSLYEEHAIIRRGFLSIKNSPIAMALETQHGACDNMGWRGRVGFVHHCILAHKSFAC